MEGGPVLKLAVFTAAQIRDPANAISRRRKVKFNRLFLPLNYSNNFILQRHPSMSKVDRVIAHQILSERKISLARARRLKAAAAEAKFLRDLQEAKLVERLLQQFGSLDRIDGASAASLAMASNDVLLAEERLVHAQLLENDELLGVLHDTMELARARVEDAGEQLEERMTGMDEQEIRSRIPALGPEFPDPLPLSVLLPEPKGRKNRSKGSSISEIRSRIPALGPEFPDPLPLSVLLPEPKGRKNRSKGSSISVASSYFTASLCSEDCDSPRTEELSSSGEQTDSEGGVDIEAWLGHSQALLGASPVIPEAAYVEAI
ncbi:hypothetical protein CVT26_014328 [Gymnopilus dilepis]|uniref:Uncharacterized protein n=1 Tax=Gymnopilus dilepis TaxID=231916 RepID=A0A409Y774_9AGAR|nr:hypothetical protein CVT26_014328 [Gymnopilus dilepis]